MGRLKNVFKQGSTENLVASLTPKQQVFVRELVHGNETPTGAARKAGYNSPQQTGYVLSRTPHIVMAVRQERARLFDNGLANIAAATLRSVMLDESAPAAARVSAARTVLEVTREIGRRQEDPTSEKDLSEMTAEELAGLIDRWKGERAALAKDITPDDTRTVDIAQDLAQLPSPAISGEA